MINARIVSSCLLAGTFGLCALAQAGEAEKPYLGLDYSQRSYESANPNASITTIPGIRLRAGTELNPHLAVEAHFVLGAGDDTGTVGGNTPYTIESPVTYAAFLRPQVKFDSLTLYGLGGYSYVEIKHSGANVSGFPTDPIKDFSFGAGLQFDINKQIGLNLDYIQYVQGLSAVSGGLLYHF